MSNVGPDNTLGALAMWNDADSLLLLLKKALLSSRHSLETASKRGICRIPSSVSCDEVPWQPHSSGEGHSVPADST